MILPAKVTLDIQMDLTRVKNTNLTKKNVVVYLDISSDFLVEVTCKTENSWLLHVVFACLPGNNNKQSILLEVLFGILTPRAELSKFPGFYPLFILLNCMLSVGLPDSKCCQGLPCSQYKSEQLQRAVAFQTALRGERNQFFAVPLALCQWRIPHRYFQSKTCILVAAQNI